MGYFFIFQSKKKSEDENIIHVAGKVDPKADIEIINLELIFADLATIEKYLKKVKPKVKSGQKEVQKTIFLLEKVKEELNKNQLVSQLNLTEEEKELIRNLNLLTLKPIIYVFNIDEKKLKNREELRQKFSDYKNKVIICAKLEAELADLPEEEAKKYLEEFGLKHSGLDELILTAYKTLNLITFFTCQNQILQAWTVPYGTLAQKAAGKIHTDFEKNFVRAEVINWQDLIKVGSESAAREKGFLRTEGKNYLVQDGDVIHFRINL